ncbi:MAG TPA: hypothetical protein VGS28_02605 [Candidatus Saccharimonadales bacterium]|nr:hypothetical protein [Candidatus Saccharimonadales bacterium]
MGTDKQHTTIQALLDAQEPLFKRAIAQLEDASGRQGADLKLQARIIEKAHAAIAELGLDPQDTSGPELYQALKNLVHSNDEHLAKSIGGKNADDIQELLPLMKKAVEKAHIPRRCWVLKHSVAKEFLRKTPPPHIMKILGYKDINLMLRKEPLAEVYGALRFAEGPEWLNRFDAHYETVTPKDFETRDIEVVVMPKERWGDIAAHFIEKKRHNITHLKELGVVMMLPIKAERLPGITISAMPLLFHYHNEIRLYSAYFKLMQVKRNFGKVFSDTLIADPDLGPIMAGQHIHWRVIQRYFGRHDNNEHPEIFQPHVQPEDLHWRKAEESMYEIDPELKFWKDMDYVGLMFGDRPLSFNLIDNSFAYSNDTPYEFRVIYHFRESLWNEVFVSYMGMGDLKDQVLEQLDNSMIRPEDLKPSK